MFGREQKKEAKKREGIGIVGRQGPIGERGQMGDHGQHGDTGDEGERGRTGATGATGARGRGLSIWQQLAMFLFVVAVFVTLSIRTEIQQRHIEAQQREIAQNTDRIIESRYQGCLGGLEILDKFNKQMEELADIERSFPLDDKRLQAKADARVKAYERGLTLPLPQCVR